MQRASLSLGPMFARTPVALTKAASFAYSALAADFQHVLKVASDELVAFCIEIAGHRVRFRVGGRDLAEHLKAPYAHRIVAADEPAVGGELAIDVWDQRATGVLCSAVPEDSLMGPFGKVLSDGTERYVNYQRPHSASWLDRETERIVAWIASDKHLYIDERAKPFHKLISVWLREKQRYLAHAGLVGRDGAGVLLTGRGGSGKSTCSTACLLAGFDYAGDDFIAVQPRGREFVGHNLFASSLLETAHFKHFPKLAGHAIAPHHVHESKKLALLADIFGPSLVSTLSINAVVLPRISGGAHHRLSPATKVEALLALAPSTILMLPLPRTEVFEVLVDLVRAVPTYWLDLSPDIDSIPDAIDNILIRSA